MALWDSVQQVGKAVAGAVAGAVVSIMSTTVTDPDSVLNPDSIGGTQTLQLPNTSAEWVTFVLAIVIGFGLPYLKRNYPSVFAAQEQLDVAQARVAEGKQSR